MAQVKFKDLENDVVHGGIELDNGDIVCGCCGGLLPKDEEGETWVILKRYGDWMNLDEAICGDDLE